MKLEQKNLSESDLSEEQRLDPKMLLRYAIYILLLVRNYNYLSDSDAGRYFSIVVTFGTLFIPFAVISPMAMRASWVYSIVVFIALPLLLKEERKAVIKYGSIFFILFLLLREYEGHFISDIYGANYANYYTIFSYYAINDIRLF